MFYVHTYELNITFRILRGTGEEEEETMKKTSGVRAETSKTGNVRIT